MELLNTYELLRGVSCEIADGLSGAQSTAKTYNLKKRGIYD